jgi:hypothetical protein
MMNIYAPTYKCELCGAVYQNSACGNIEAQSGFHLKGIIAEQALIKQFNYKRALGKRTLTDLHLCPNKNVGMAKLIGYTQAAYDPKLVTMYKGLKAEDRARIVKAYETDGFKAVVPILEEFKLKGSASDNHDLLDYLQTVLPRSVKLSFEDFVNKLVGEKGYTYNIGTKTWFEIAAEHGISEEQGNCICSILLYWNSEEREQRAYEMYMSI